MTLGSMGHITTGHIITVRITVAAGTTGTTLGTIDGPAIPGTGDITIRGTEILGMRDIMTRGTSTRGTVTRGITGITTYITRFTILHIILHIIRFSLQGMWFTVTEAARG